jgi:hypothetical protein
MLLKNAHLYFIIAAHCVFGRDGATIPTSELIIFLGKTRTDGEWTNDGGVKAKAVINFISGVKLSYHESIVWALGGENNTAWWIQCREIKPTRYRIDTAQVSSPAFRYNCHRLPVVRVRK